MSRRRAAQLPKPGTRLPQEDGFLRREDRARRVRRLVSEGAQLLALGGDGPEKASRKLEEARRLDPGDVAAAINLGGAYILQGEHDRAVPVLEAAAELEPANVMIWINLAAAYLGKLSLATLERQDKAIAAYERALLLDPHTPHADYNLGLIYLERSDMLRAAKHFSGALETNPDDYDARHWLDKIHSRTLRRDVPRDDQTPVFPLDCPGQSVLRWASFEETGSSAEIRDR